MTRILYLWNSSQLEKLAKTDKGLQLVTCLRRKAQKVFSELKPSQKKIKVN